MSWQGSSPSTHTHTHTHTHTPRRWTEAITNASKAYDDGDEWGALAQFVLAAEQGSEAAAANAAWMLRRGPAGSGPGFPAGPGARLELAARMYERAAARGRCAACAVELGNLVHDAEALGLSRPRNLTEVGCCPSRVIPTEGG